MFIILSVVLISMFFFMDLSGVMQTVLLTLARFILGKNTII
jgi:hypothetical protein